ncbi:MULTISPECIES: PhzF family phenazine biosynthesis protein [unclassified Sphingobacterium]|uniref:PhzF family phenazine biosynthesis protein n=1 Tax=unclassified Sphingobacterium TaxID=2609468 RepID=UPI001A9F8E60|nr:MULTISPECIES: PhzF family phenazine biosynthesis protein [unclassified Sphingobacterium]MCS3556286.1 PhzF family phenazine biosynthesis protein [Sphingobacterium sp. JUb21]
MITLFKRNKNMKLTIYQVDAFTDMVFKGNPASVCPLTEWLADDILLKIAAENNLSETAFYVPKGDGYEIRWFTPASEVDLCGHATLATAYVLAHCEKQVKETINFYSPRSGKLPVSVQQDKFVLNFPADQFSETELSDALLAVTDKKPIAAYRGKTDYMLVFEKQNDIEALKPNLPLMIGMAARGFIVTAKGENHDFVSRFFGPAVGVNEDPVCGSAHTTLTPYWAGQLNKTELRAFQLSDRTGEVYCRLLGDRVELAGNAVLYMKGEIYI